MQNEPGRSVPVLQQQVRQIQELQELQLLSQMQQQQLQGEAGRGPSGFGPFSGMGKGGAGCMQHRFVYADGEDDGFSDDDAPPMDFPMTRPDSALSGPGPVDQFAATRKAQPGQGRKGQQPEAAGKGKSRAADKGGGKGGRGNDAVAGDRCELFVGRLGVRVTEQMLHELFRSKGIDVRSLKLPLDAVKNSNKGYAFVGLANPAQMQMAIEQLNGQSLDGRPINVEVSGSSGPGDDQKAISAISREMHLLSSMAQKTKGKGSGAKSDDSSRAEGLLGDPALARGGGKGGDAKGGGKRREKGGGGGGASGKSGKGQALPGDSSGTLGKMKPGNSPNKLFVGNLPSEATNEDIKTALRPAGEVVSVRIVEGGYSNIAFVEFRDPAAVVTAVRQLQGVNIKGKPARMEFQSSKGGKGNAPVEVPATMPAASAPSPAPAASCVPGVLAPGPLPPGPMANNKPPMLPKGILPIAEAADGQ
eukprot:TRINITY_DN1939_c0_g2_i1.p1 TRINITY_DN1939_c0_g2~~TRINITY_DN1939_c0_g2_i1.p1  ORF type:complete len:522 (-),score=154.47 TRINITY_DN1939_c0_g2_i1:54-1478(-)